SGPTPGISLRSIELPANARASGIRAHFRQAKQDAAIIFLVFTFLGFGVAGIAESIWFGDFSTIQTALIAIACGLLASLGMALLHTLDLPSTYKELKSGVCIEASVSCQRAIRVRIARSSLEGIALDCGDDVLVLIGEWWLNNNRSEIWMDPKSRKNFPAQQFRIQFLPRSAKVLAVYVESGPLFVEEPEPVEPLISLPFSRYSEVVHVKQNLRSITLDEGNAKLTL
ncbi:MAG TPA: hypothetical protein PKD54_15645, partial [Pirellulaceae bacterium]|nr:hypothetical protein [Pirellulaceae bacterium]